MTWCVEETVWPTMYSMRDILTTDLYNNPVNVYSCLDLDGFFVTTLTYPSPGRKQGYSTREIRGNKTQGQDCVIVCRPDKLLS